MCYEKDFLEETILDSQRNNPTAEIHLHPTRTHRLALDRQEKEKTLCCSRGQCCSHEEDYMEREIPITQRCSEKTNGRTRQSKSHEIRLETQVQRPQKVCQKRKSLKKSSFPQLEEEVLHLQKRRPKA